MTTTSKGIYFFDIETNGLYDEADTVWCISVKELKNGARSLVYADDPAFFPDGTLEEALSLLLNAKQVIGHNIIGYDLPVLNKIYGFVLPDTVKATDTLILSRLFNPDRPGGHSLSAWGERLGYPKGDYTDWTGGLTEEMMAYCKRDSDVTHEVYKALREEVKGQRWGESIDLEHDVARAIADQEVNGVLFDLELANNTMSKLQQQIEEVDQYITPMLPLSIDYGPQINPYTKTGKLAVRAARVLGDPEAKPAGPFKAVTYKGVDLNSVHQVKKWLDSIGWVPTEFTPTGGGKLTEDSFLSLEDGKLGELLTKRVQSRHRMGQIQGWIDFVTVGSRKDGRITASANTIGTPTGRFRHRQVVNVPSAATYGKKHEKAGQLHWMDDTSIPQRPMAGTEMRAMFKAAEGHVIVGHDASGLELRMLAHYMNDSNYTEILLHGDIHSHNQKLADLHSREAAKTFI